MTEAAASRPGPAVACQLCGRPVEAAERQCPAFALAGIIAHAGCCGGCATRPARPEAVDRSGAAA